MTVNGSAGTGVDDGLTDQLAELYDRQIRLWGSNTQVKLLKARVLLVRCGPVLAEISKNLVLAGVGSVTVLDEDRTVTEKSEKEFLMAINENYGVGMKYNEAILPYLQKIAPFTETDSVTVQSFSQITPDFISSGNYDIVVATDLPFPTLSSINRSCRESGRPFFASRCIGPFGFAFADPGDCHRYVSRKERPGEQKPSQPRVVSTARRIVSVTQLPESELENKDVVEEEITYEDLYSPLDVALTNPLPSETIRQAVRKMRHAGARQSAMGHVAEKPQRSGTDLLLAFKCLNQFEESLLAELQKSGASELLPSAMTDSLVHEGAQDRLMVSHKTLNVDVQIPLPLEFFRGYFWKMFEASLGLERAQQISKLAEYRAKKVSTAACLGGLIVEQIVNMLSHKSPILHNLLTFDGEEYASPSFVLVDETKCQSSIAQEEQSVNNGEAVILLDDD